MAAGNRTPTDGAHLLDYIRVVLKRLWLIVGVFTLVVGVVGIATLRATPMYRASAIINIRQPSMILRSIDPTAVLQGVNQSQIYMNTQYERLKQLSTMRRMVEDHGLVDWPEFEGRSAGDIARSLQPFVEVVPQLYVLKEKDLARAKQLLQLDLPLEEPEDDWVCAECGIDVEGTFERCWKCGSGRE